MKKKLWMSFLIIIIAVTGAVALSSCSDPQEQTHVCTFGDWITVTEPTCSQTGLQERYCIDQNCNKKEQQTLEIDPNVHSLQPVGSKAMSCTEDGHIAYNHCTKCNKDFNDEGVQLSQADIVIPKSHSMQPVGREEASCTEDGHIAYNHCARCNKNFNDEGVQLSQTDIVIPKSHSLQPVGREEASCTEDGHIAYNHCARCNKNFNDSGAELTQEDIIISKGHMDFDEETLYCSACDKYIIKTVEHLKIFRDSVNNGNNYSGKIIELEADIDLNDEEWTPIANVTRKETDHSKFFKGTFEGNEHTISGIASTNNTDNACVGLFGVTANAVIRNLNIIGTFTNTVDTVAGLVGCDLSAEDEVTVVSNCSVNATIYGNCVGGILSRAYGAGKTVIDGCTTDGTFTATADGKVGGMVCINLGKDLTHLSNCVNNASISGGKGGTGGIFGLANNNLKIEKCSNTGDIGTADKTDKFVGGILGYEQGTTNIVIERCVNSGDICGINAGGIFGIHGGNQQIVITSCSNSGTVSGNIVGGIASTASGSIVDCINTGIITGGSETGDGTAGGIVGSVSGNTDMTITGCSGGTAEISARYAGRLIGTVHNALSVTYLAIDDSNDDSYENGLGTVGCVGAYTAYSTMVVTEGTMRGKVISYGQAQGWIVIAEQAKWLGYDETEEKTTWNYSYTAEDFLKTNATPIPLQNK